MPEKSNNPFQFWQELKRRKVIRVITVYAAAAFVILELASIIVEPLRLPDWTLQMVIVLLSIGFVIAVILSWVYDITPEGVQKTGAIGKVEDLNTETPSRIRGWKVATYVSGVIIIGLLVINIFGVRSIRDDFSDMEKSIAVLHFENLSHDDEQAWFSEGITDIIINQLSKISEFRVLGGTSTMKYKTGDKSIAEIGEELGVNFIIEGTVQRADDNIRIIVQLLRVRNEDHLWSDVYDKPWKDIFSIQEEIALDVSNELNIALSPNEKEQITEIPTENLEAYDLYLQGRYRWNKRTKEGLDKSIEFFEEAISLDNEFALAYTGLADAYMIFGEWNFMNPDSAYKKAKILALESIFIDNGNAEPYATLGIVTVLSEVDDELAELYFKQSLRINPNYSSAHQWYAIHLTSRGRFQESFSHMERALELDPNSAIMHYGYGFILYQAQDYDKSLIQLDKTSKIDPELPHGNYKFLCYLQKGLYNEMIIAYENILNGNPLFPDFRETANNVLNNEGMNGLIRYIIDVELQAPNRYKQLLPILYTSIGNKDKALDILEINIKERGTDYIFINVEPGFMDLHSEPKFKELLKMIGMQT